MTTTITLEVRVGYLTPTNVKTNVMTEMKFTAAKGARTHTDDELTPINALVNAMSLEHEIDVTISTWDGTRYEQLAHYYIDTDRFNNLEIFTLKEGLKAIESTTSRYESIQSMLKHAKKTYTGACKE